MEYYAGRNRLLNKQMKMKLDSLLDYFFDLYKNCKDRGFFDQTFGLKGRISPLLQPSPKHYFLTHLHEDDIYPIEASYQDFSESTLFTVIEILYRNIGGESEFDILGAEEKNFC